MTSIALLLHQLDTAFDTKAWHGPTLKGVLRGVDESLASWRPATDRHTIWELTIHCAYWKYAVLRKITGEKKGSFPLDGSNWFVRPDQRADWVSERKVLTEIHSQLRSLVLNLSASNLDTKPDGSKYTFTELIAGVAAHDLYHAGQIQLMKRLAGEAKLDPHGQ